MGIGSKTRAGLRGADGQRILTVLAVLATGAMAAEVVLGSHHGHEPTAIAAAVLAGACLAACLRWPAGAAVGLGITLLFEAVAGGQLTNDSATLLFVVVAIVFSLALRSPRERFWPAFAVVMICGEIAGQLDSPTDRVATLLWVALVPIGAPALAGRRLRWRTEVNRALELQADEIERNREARARAAVRAERTRIAGELHDVVAHDVTVMIVQAQAAARLVRNGRADAAASIESIETTGREALNEMRRLLGVLRRGDEDRALAPQPSLRHLDAMMQDARDRGLRVELERSGEERELPPGLDLTAFRIMQEALRSIVDHGAATVARAHVGYSPEALAVELEADGRVSAACLEGLRERARVYGGDVEVRPATSGGTLAIRLPLAPEAVTA